ncbi:MAG: Rpn family recombination-promoting nuclease/putative transposase [Bryobacterales bacterium]|nr:Rpn family recombination-promoting nuclease/putative transposase [Bryobacterales bacterium]
MDGTTFAGSVHANDHDRNFKELLTTFFVEFLALFFPKLAAMLDPDSIEFLGQEYFVDLPDGQRYLADIVVKARFAGSDAFFLIHVEHQSDTPAKFPERMFRYFMAMYERYRVPVYPIVVFSHDKPAKPQPREFRMAFPDGEVLRFRYHVVQLNRLSWRRFLTSSNPVASALMAKMKMAERDRPRVKAQCLRLMVKLRLDPARQELIAQFVDRYLNLTEIEERRFRRTIERMDLQPEEKEKVVEYVTSWEQRGVEKGIAIGIEKGRNEGIEKGRSEGIEKGRSEGIETLQAVLLDLIGTRFGPPSDATIRRIQSIQSMNDLRQLAHSVMHASSLSELGL